MRPIWIKIVRNGQYRSCIMSIVFGHRLLDDVSRLTLGQCELAICRDPQYARLWVGSTSAAQLDANYLARRVRHRVRRRHLIVATGLVDFRCKSAPPLAAAPSAHAPAASMSIGRLVWILLRTGVLVWRLSLLRLLWLLLLLLMMMLIAHTCRRGGSSHGRCAKQHTWRQHCLMMRVVHIWIDRRGACR